ncbi:conserved hypothetical protein [Vibrio chagasii]|nr:conserved hypothetical protein [Vibrio chagasii]
MGLFKSLTGRSCSYPASQKLDFTDYKTGVSCQYYCKSTDTCLAKYAKSSPQRAIYSIVEQPPAYQYTIRLHPEALVDMLNRTYRNLCPKLQSLGVEDALLRRRDGIVNEINQVDSYIISTAKWLRESLEEIDYKLQDKRQKMLEEACDEAEFYEEELPTSIDESNGSEFYYYKSDLYFETTGRWQEYSENTKNCIAWMVKSYFCWLLEAIIMNEMDDSTKKLFTDMHSYYFNIISNITEFSGAGSLHSILQKSKPRSRY